MIVVGLLPYCVNSTVEWKFLPNASTFPVFCLGILVIVYTLALFVILHCFVQPGSNFTVSTESYNKTWRSLFLQFITAFLLMAFALRTNGEWSIDIIIVISPLPTLLHTPVLSLWAELKDGELISGRGGRWTVGRLTHSNLAASLMGVTGAVTGAASSTSGSSGGVHGPWFGGGSDARASSG
eukprot:SAG22_NODE_300_length_12752_cov_3.102426_8_plen_182_part_00